MSDGQGELARWAGIVRRSGRFAGFVWRRFDGDHCLATAGALSYTSLLAIVPLLALTLSILRIFPFFAEMQEEAEQHITGVLLPTQSIQAIEGLHEFIGKASNLTGFGVVGLAVTAVLLLNTITHAFAGIWRTTALRSLVTRILAYWAILTMGPLLFGLAIWLTGEVYTAGTAYGGGAFTVVMRWIGPLLPVLLEAGAFALLYLVVPNRPVRRWDAITGGLAAALLFEVLKRGFALYLLYFPSYQVIYGAISAVPIFLVWMYSCWAVVLFGAEVAAALPEWREERLKELKAQRAQKESAMQAEPAKAASSPPSDPAGSGSPPAPPVRLQR
jgi:membrane protein